MSSKESFLLVWLLLWVLGSSFCLVFSELLSSTTPFLLSYWFSAGLIQGILLRFYRSRAYPWALTSAIFGMSLCILLPVFIILLSHKIPNSKVFLLSPFLTLKAWLSLISLAYISNLSATAYDALPLASISAAFLSLFMFAAGAFLGYLQQRALGIRFSWWWLLASGSVWTVGIVVFLMGAFLLNIGSGFSMNYASTLALLISGAVGSFIKGISLIFIFNCSLLKPGDI